MKLNSTIAYSVGNPQIISEQFDEEVVIVDLETGSYYSLSGPGGEIWSAVESGLGQQQIVERLSATYQGDSSEIQTSIARLLESLQMEKLIVPRPIEASDASAPGIGEVATSDPASRPAWQEPVLQKYADMQALLLLDPIHEVDSAGWPQVKPETAAPADVAHP